MTATTTTTTAMHMLVPYNHSHNHPRRDIAAIDEACRLAHSGDTITVLACVIVPAYYAVDVIPGAVWKQTCVADRSLARAKAYLESHVAEGVTVRILRVQARDESAAIIAGATHRNADLILMGGWPAPFTGIAARFGVAGIVARHVQCGVQVVSATKRPVSASASVSVPVSSSVSEATAPVPVEETHGHAPHTSITVRITQATPAEHDHKHHGEEQANDAHRA